MASMAILWKQEETAGRRARTGHLRYSTNYRASEYNDFPVSSVCFLPLEVDTSCIKMQAYVC